jgi:hypothetical protein
MKNWLTAMAAAMCGPDRGRCVNCTVVRELAKKSMIVGRENPDRFGIGAHEVTLPGAFRCHSLFSILA